MASSSPKSGDLARIGAEVTSTFVNHYVIVLYYTFAKSHDALESLREATKSDSKFKALRAAIVTALEPGFKKLHRNHFPLRTQYLPSDNESARPDFAVRRT